MTTSTIIRDAMFKFDIGSSTNLTMFLQHLTNPDTYNSGLGLQLSMEFCGYQPVVKNTATEYWYGVNGYSTMSTLTFASFFETVDLTGT